MSTTVPTAPPGLLTAEEFAARHAGDYVELIDGRVEPIMPGGARHGEVCVNAAVVFHGFIKPNKLGLVCGNDTFVLTRRGPDRVRGGDVVFWGRDKVPEGPTPDGLLDAPPDLVVETRSPSDGWNDVFLKVGEYLSAGVRVVVVLDPGTATASAYRKDEFQQIFHNGDEVALPDVLPGFAVPVAKFFE